MLVLKDISEFLLCAEGSELGDSLLKRSLAQALEETDLDLENRKRTWEFWDKDVFQNEACACSANT